MSGPEPRRRASDSPWRVRGHRFVRENWYRDVWLFAITLLLVLALNASSASSDRARVLAAQADATARLAARLAVRVANQATEIQRQRRDTIRSACRTQNNNHDATLKALDTVIKRVPRARRAEAQANKASTTFLLNAIVPHRDCALAVERALGIRRPPRPAPPPILPPAHPER